MVAIKIAAFIPVAVDPANNKIRLSFMCFFNQQFVHLRLDPVVGIHKADVFALGDVQPRVAGGADAPVLLVNHDNARIICGIFVADLAAAVRRSVVNQNQLKVSEGLCKNAVDALGQILLCLEDWNNDG